MSTIEANQSGGAAPGRAMLRIETRLFLREPVGVVWGLALPVIAFVVLGLIPGLSRPEPYLGGRTFLQVYQPVLIVASVALLALSGLPPVLGSYREGACCAGCGPPPCRLLACSVPSC